MMKKQSTANTEESRSSCSDAGVGSSGRDDEDEDYVHVRAEDNHPHAYTTENEQFDVHEKFMKTFRPWHLLDPYRPWVLVPNGSFGGYFDWVPRKFRVGPWSTVAKVYWMVLWYVAFLSACYLYNQETETGISISAAAQPVSSEWWFQAVYRNFYNQETGPIHENSPSAAELQKYYPAAWTAKWWYHSVGCAWMVLIMLTILLQSPAGYRAWSTFTVISWTLLTIRHGLCAAMPWHPNLSNAVEWLRFPCAMYHSVVFIVWNFVLVPYLLKVVMKNDPAKQSNFIKFCASFRLFNLHVVNIFLCVAHIYWASPPRQLTYADLYVACVGMLLYMAFYLYVLDRLGVHLYPVFSPRVGKLVLVSWSGAIVLCLTIFYGWKRLLQSDE